jgi:hypothetical protein
MVVGSVADSEGRNFWPVPNRNRNNHFGSGFGSGFEISCKKEPYQNKVVTAFTLYFNACTLFFSVLAHPTDVRDRALTLIGVLPRLAIEKSLHCDGNLERRPI